MSLFVIKTHGESGWMSTSCCSSSSPRKMMKENMTKNIQNFFISILSIWWNRRKDSGSSQLSSLSKLQYAPCCQFWAIQFLAQTFLSLFSLIVFFGKEEQHNACIMSDVSHSAISLANFEICPSQILMSSAHVDIFNFTSRGKNIQYQTCQIFSSWPCEAKFSHNLYCTCEETAQRRSSRGWDLSHFLKCAPAFNPKSWQKMCQRCEFQGGWSRCILPHVWFCKCVKWHSLQFRSTVLTSFFKDFLKFELRRVEGALAPLWPLDKHQEKTNIHIDICRCIYIYMYMPQVIFSVKELMWFFFHRPNFLLVVNMVKSHK